MTNQQQLPLPHTEPESIREERADPLGAAQKAAYSDHLRQYLQDPDFRQIEGFPIGEDEAILALSDPPYYTACPNPFLPEIIEQWQQERAEIRAELGLPADAQPNASGYHREPFAADVSEGKNDPIYNAHSYHTKVPHKAIMRYILHYTDPGDIVFDGFCGTGMTGVAAQLCGDRKTVESLGYVVDDHDNIYDRPPTDPKAGGQGSGGAGEKTLPISRLGPRKAVLNDLSPAATFIAYNYNTPVDVKAFEKEAKRILRQVEEKCGWMYETIHTDGKTKGRINWTVWSDVFVCPECSTEMVFWDVTVDENDKKINDEWRCSGCGVLLAKSPRKSGALKVERAWETTYDRALDQTIQRVKQLPVLINYSVGRNRYEKHPDAADFDLICKIEESNIPYWFPNDPMMFKGEHWGDTWRAGVHAGITHIHHFYTKRSLWTLSALWEAAPSLIFRSVLLGGLSVGVKMSRFRVPLWFNKTSGPMKGMTSGTLYVPSLSGEQSWLNIFGARAAAVKRQLVAMQAFRGARSTATTTNSMTHLNIANDCAHYIFTDPPFGDNLMYSELNFINEAWQKVITNNTEEAISNTTQQKGVLEYQKLMEKCFIEYKRILKPGRWMTVEFHNSQNRVWNAIQEAILRAGFMIADVRTLDKKQGSFKQVTATGSVK